MKKEAPAPAEEVIALLQRLEDERIPLLRRLAEIDAQRLRLLKMEAGTRRAEDPVASRERRARLIRGLV